MYSSCIHFDFMLTLMKHRDIKQRQTKLLKERRPRKVTNHRDCVGSYNATGLDTVSLDAYQFSAMGKSARSPPSTEKQRL